MSKRVSPTIIIACAALFVSLAAAGIAHAGTCLVGDPWAYQAGPRCPVKPYGPIALRSGESAVADELADEQLPMSATITGCHHQIPSQIACFVMFGPVTYSALGGFALGTAPRTRTVSTQTLQIRARRVGKHLMLVWYGHGKPPIGYDWLTGH